MIEIQSIEPTDVQELWKVIFVDKNGIQTIELIPALDYEEVSLKASNILFHLKKRG